LHRQVDDMHKTAAIHKIVSNEGEKHRGWLTWFSFFSNQISCLLRIPDVPQTPSS
jgi:hypothetical protein